MKNAALGLLLGLAVGGINQWIMWWAVYRVGPNRTAAVIARYLGGCAVRLSLDALTIYAGWLLTRSAWGIVASAVGLLLATAVFTLWQYRSLRKRRRLRREVK